MLFSILVGLIVELCSNIWSNYVRKFRPTTQILFGWLQGWQVSWFLLLLYISNFVRLFGIMFAVLFELCSASGLKPREKKLSGSPGKSKFPALCVIYSKYY